MWGLDFLWCIKNTHRARGIRVFRPGLDFAKCEFGALKSGCFRNTHSDQRIQAFYPHLDAAGGGREVAKKKCHVRNTRGARGIRTFSETCNFNGAILEQLRGSNFWGASKIRTALEEYELFANT